MVQYIATRIRDEKRSRMLKKKSRLKEIKISGYKSLGTDIQPINLEMSNLNIIIGANGAGKSNFISFFQMLAKHDDGCVADLCWKEWLIRVITTIWI